MALPAIRALASRWPVQIHAPRWGAELYRGMAVRGREEAPEGDAGVLFKPSLGAAWRWRGLPRLVGIADPVRRWLLTDPVPDPGGHRREGYRAIAAALIPDLEALPPPEWRWRGRAVPLAAGTVGLNPWSPSATVRWPGFRELADRLAGAGRPVVFFCGPGEEGEVGRIAGPHPLIAGLSLEDFAATLQGCALLISNDSGAAHFAAACGARVRVIYGPTDPARTGPGAAPEAGAIRGPGRWCQPCYRKSCVIGLGCLGDVGVGQAEASC